MSCVDFKTIVLRNYQKLPSKFILNSKNRGLLLLFDVGHGKTITSIAMIRCLLTKYPNKKVIVLTPSSLVTNYERELEKVPEFKSTAVSVHSYNKYINHIKANGNYMANSSTIVVLDEAQYLIGQGSAKFKSIFDHTRDAFKVILLSATPIKNNPDEMANILSMINGYKITKTVIQRIFDIKETQEREASIRKLLKCKIAYHKPVNVNTTEFADRVDHNVPLIMSKEYYQSYTAIEKDLKSELPDSFKTLKNLTVFANGIRRAVNSISVKEGSPKINWIVYKIKKDLGLISGYHGNKKVLIYSNWLESGIDLVKAELNILGIKYAEVSGRLSRAQKDKELKKYNKNEVSVILISASGSEGLNLKNTRSVILMEPHWNSARLEQVIGRAIRLNSHKTLPEPQRKVDVYHLILKKPLSVKNTDHTLSADEMLAKLSKSKDNVINTFYDTLKAVSIEHDKSCFK